ncbi:unnamed protein product, partial [Effrenium voratum]
PKRSTARHLLGHRIFITADQSAQSASQMSHCCSCSCSWYKPENLAPADAWWKEAIRHETENRWYVRQLPGSWAATFGGSQMDALIKHQVEAPSDRSFRPFGRRVLSEPRGGEARRALAWAEGEGELQRADPVPEKPPQLPPPEVSQRELQTTLRPMEPAALSPAAREPVAREIRAAELREPVTQAESGGRPSARGPNEEMCGCGVPQTGFNFCPTCGARAQGQGYTEAAPPAGPVQSKAKSKAKAKPRPPEAEERHKTRLGNWSMLHQRELAPELSEPEPATKRRPFHFRPKSRARDGGKNECLCQRATRERSAQRCTCYCHTFCICGYHGKPQVWACDKANETLKKQVRQRSVSRGRLGRP